MDGGRDPSSTYFFSEMSVLWCLRGSPAAIWGDLGANWGAFGLAWWLRRSLWLPAGVPFGPSCIVTWTPKKWTEGGVLRPLIFCSKMSLPWCPRKSTGAFLGSGGGGIEAVSSSMSPKRDQMKSLHKPQSMWVPRSFAIISLGAYFLLVCRVTHTLF